jgi:hypothetical protein
MIYVDDVAEIVDPFDIVFDEYDTTETLESLRQEIEDDIGAIEWLVSQLEAWVAEAEEVMDQIAAELDEREADEDDEDDGEGDDVEGAQAEAAAL